MALLMAVAFAVPLHLLALLIGLAVRWQQTPHRAGPPLGRWPDPVAAELPPLFRLPWIQVDVGALGLALLGNWLPLVAAVPTGVVLGIVAGAVAMPPLAARVIGRPHWVASGRGLYHPLRGWVRWRWIQRWWLKDGMVWVVAGCSQVEGLPPSRSQRFPLGPAGGAAEELLVDYVGERQVSPPRPPAPAPDRNPEAHFNVVDAAASVDPGLEAE